MCIVFDNRGIAISFHFILFHFIFFSFASSKDDLVNIHHPYTKEKSTGSVREKAQSLPLQRCAGLLKEEYCAFWKNSDMKSLTFYEYFCAQMIHTIGYLLLKQTQITGLFRLIAIISNLGNLNILNFQMMIKKCIVWLSYSDLLCAACLC